MPYDIGHSHGCVCFGTRSGKRVNRFAFVPHFVAGYAIGQEAFSLLIVTS